MRRPTPKDAEVVGNTAKAKPTKRTGGSDAYEESQMRAWLAKREAYTAQIAGLRDALDAMPPVLAPDVEQARNAAVRARLAPGGDARERAGQMLAEARAKRPKRDEA